jgi:hypothetical protein
MTFPFKITNPEDIPPGGSWTVTQEDLRNIEEQNEALIAIRGRVITASLLIEQKLDEALAMLFVGNQMHAINLFKELLLEKEFFTFMNKWKLFRGLSKREIIKFAKEEERKVFLSKLQKIIETRDRFAHGDVVFSGTNPKLDYLIDGEHKTQVLDNSYFDGLNEVFSYTHQILDQLIRHLKGEEIAPPEADGQVEGDEEEKI